MEGYICSKTYIDGHLIADIDMLDDTTCYLAFEEEEVGDFILSYIVEYWLEDRTFHYVKRFFTKEGVLQNSENDCYLTEEGRAKCEAYMKEWVDSLDTDDEEKEEPNEYEKLYDQIQDVTNKVTMFCGIKKMEGIDKPRQTNY